MSAHLNLGAALASKGDLDAAVKEYREALRINHDDAAAHYNLGVALGRKGDLNAAISEYQEALRADPSNREARCSLRIALSARKGKVGQNKLQP